LLPETAAKAVVAYSTEDVNHKELVAEQVQNKFLPSWTWWKLCRQRRRFYNALLLCCPRREKKKGMYICMVRSMFVDTFKLGSRTLLCFDLLLPQILYEEDSIHP
jgi:hypothetical protein